MLGHLHAPCRRHQGGGGGDVEAAGVVSAGAHDLKELHAGLHLDGVAPVSYTHLDVYKRQVIYTGLGDRQRFEPWGIDGGHNGAGGCYDLTRSGQSESQRLTSKCTGLVMNRGDVVCVRTPGAGGWGDPKRRDVQKVLEDVLEGKVSPGAAASEYGVALKRDKMLWTVDEEQTDVLRKDVYKRQAQIDAGGALKVGPRSSGATPGPACYMRGGELPCATDANIILGKLNSKKILGGRMDVDIKLAEKAIRTHICEKSNLDLQRAAAGIVSVINSNMVRAVRVVSVERGYDPSEFTLMAFGGAGPLHACEVARDMGIKQVLIPPSPGTLCSLGLLMADTKFDLSCSNLTTAELTSCLLYTSRCV